MATRSDRTRGKKQTSGKKRTAATKASAAAKRARPKKRASGRRDLVKARNATLYAKRGARGQFKEMDEKGRSLAADRRRRAKTRTKSGYGDRGDRAA